MHAVYGMPCHTVRSLQQTAHIPRLFHNVYFVLCILCSCFDVLCFVQKQLFPQPTLSVSQSVSQPDSQQPASQPFVVVASVSVLALLALLAVRCVV